MTQAHVNKNEFAQDAATRTVQERTQHVSVLAAHVRTSNEYARGALLVQMCLQTQRILAQFTGTRNMRLLVHTRLHAQRMSVQ